jgi:hypothetical protein
MVFLYDNEHMIWIFRGIEHCSRKNLDFRTGSFASEILSLQHKNNLYAYLKFQVLYISLGDFTLFWVE